MSSEILYSIALRACPMVGDMNFAKLVQAAGSAEEVWNLSKKILKSISGIGEKIARGIGNDEFLKFAEKEINFCEKYKIEIKLKHLNQLPPLLSQCEDAPAVFYQKGKIDFSADFLSIVGTRSMTAYGKEFVEDLAKQLKNRNIYIVSGLALGVDGCAHAEALKNNLKTIAVLAHGFKTLYPPKNRNLAKEILEKDGLLCTEFPFEQKPEREYFLQRNRIIAGFSPVTTVVESAFSGGSMTTVACANAYNREVYALPGKIDDKYSQGCNRVIAQNKAKIISTVQDILDELGYNEALQARKNNLFQVNENQLSMEAKPVYKMIKSEKIISLDDLSEKLEIPAFRLLPVLLDLELSGCIKAHSGRQYSVI